MTDPHAPRPVDLAQVGGPLGVPRPPSQDTLDWLLQGDPAIRWRTLRDLTGVPPAEVAAERARVATEGWGAQLLGLQDADGRWAGALYSPKWTSTTYTLLLLQRLGLPADHPQAQLACRILWDNATTWDGGGLNLAKTIREPETCITGMLVLLAASFGQVDERVRAAVRWLLGQQLEDGGWNCETVRTGSRHGSFHTTITVLEALAAYRRVDDDALDEPMRAGRDFFLEHRLYRSHRTGEPVAAAFTHFPFPPQWHFDVLRGLEHFCDTGAPPDDRLTDAVDVLRRRRDARGRWPVDRAHPGRHWFRMEERGPSRWSTLRCLRVLSWWDGSKVPPVGDPGPVRRGPDRRRMRA